MDKKVLIFGAGKLARMASDIATNEGLFETAAFLVDHKYRTSSSFMDKPLIDFEDINKYFTPEKHELLLAIGHKNMRSREIVFHRLKDCRFDMTNLISKNAMVAGGIQMGVNNIILGGAYIGNFTTIGDNNFICPNAYIGHDFTIGSHNYFSPGCTMGSQTTVGNLSFIGIGATTINGLKIADETLLGAGSTLLHDTEPHSLYAGNPANKVKDLKENGIMV